MAEGAHKRHLVAYHLTTEQWQRLEDAARGAGHNPNEWCRRLTLHELDHGHGLTRNEQFLLGEIAIIRYVLTNGLSRMAGGLLTLEEWKEVEVAAVESGRRKTEQVLLKRLLKRTE